MVPGTYRAHDMHELLCHDNDETPFSDAITLSLQPPVLTPDLNPGDYYIL